MVLKIYCLLRTTSGPKSLVPWGSDGLLILIYQSVESVSKILRVSLKFVTGLRLLVAGVNFHFADRSSVPETGNLQLVTYCALRLESSALIMFSHALSIISYTSW